MSERSVVLVVEDDELLRHAIVDLLRSEGFVVADACDGQEALRLLPRTRPTVVVLDLLMPVMDGPTFLEHKLADPSFAATPVVIFSSHPAPELHAKPAVVSVLPKPDGIDELLKTLKTIAPPTRAARVAHR